MGIQVGDLAVDLFLEFFESKTRIVVAHELREIAFSKLFGTVYYRG
mgnify:CR=1 FL=1